MKKTKRGFWPASIIAMMLIACSGCSKKNIPPGDDGGAGQIVKKDGIGESDLVTYQGDIGMVFDARSLQKKGYKPKTIVLNVKASSGNFSKTMELSPYTLMGQIKLPIDSLSTEVHNELKQGVEVTARVLDASGKQISQETISKISFQSNPPITPFSANGLADLNTQVKLNSNTPHYIQVMENGVATSKASYNTLAEGDDFVYTTGVATVAFTGEPNEGTSLYSFEAIPNTTNTYAIKNLRNGRYLRINRNWKFYGTPRQMVVADLNWQFPTDFINGNTDARFVIKKLSDGVYWMESVQGEKIKLGPISTGYRLMINYPGAKEILFRFVPMNIDWSIENIETRYLEPILPPAKNGFSYNSTLVNCGNGTLKQTVGNSKTVETVTTIGWQESISITSRSTASASLTLGLEVSASFFGNGATYSAEAKGGYEYSTSNATETTNWNEARGSTSETFFSQREVTVPPKSASLVYDAFQSYDNIKVNLVQRLRVRATEHNTREKLSGQEIATQFHFNGFNGVITEIGSDFIEVTLRGVGILDKVFKSKSEVQAVAPECS